MDTQKLNEAAQAFDEIMAQLKSRKIAIPPLDAIQWMVGEEIMKWQKDIISKSLTNMNFSTLMSLHNFLGVMLEESNRDLLEEKKAVEKMNEIAKESTSVRARSKKARSKN